MKSDEMEEYSFLFRKEFLAFIERHKEKLIGQRIRGFYSEGFFDSGSAAPIALELDDYCIILDYMFYSNITITVTTPEAFRKNLEPADQFFLDPEFPFRDCRIEDVLLDGFSHEFEINPSTGETRPAGGDYFSVIRVQMDNGRTMCICAASPMCDGYLDTWSEWTKIPHAT